MWRSDKTEKWLWASTGGNLWKGEYTGERMGVWVILAKFLLQTQSYAVSGVMSVSLMIKSHFPLTGMGGERRAPSQREIFTLPLGREGEGGELLLYLLFLKYLQLEIKIAKGAYFGVAYSNTLQVK